MNHSSPRSILMQSGLISAVAVPVVYFGVQIAAAFFYPGYSFARDSASMLGTYVSSQPWVFNLGAILTGVAALVGATGLNLALRTTTTTFVAWLNSIALVATGVMSIKAGMFPLPDPRHASWGLLMWLTICMPAFLLIGAWKGLGTGLRLYLGACVLLIVLSLPFLTGTLPFGMQPGTFQRLVALATFVPVGVVGYFFLREPPRAPIR